MSNQIWDPDLRIPGQSPLKTGMTVFLSGPIGTIKTTWAGSWPSPVFLSAGHEGGDDSLAMLPTVLGINPPPVYHIDTTAKMKSKVEYIAQAYEAYGWKTVVIDSVTFYSDIYIREIIEAYQRQDKDPQMQQRDWGFLEAHLCKEIAQRLHGTKLNVIWIALTKEKWSLPDRHGERHLEGYKPMIQGAAAIKLPAMCKMVLHASRSMVPDGKGGMTSVPVFHTAPSMLAQDVRHKYATMFPEGVLTDPEFGTWPTFRALNDRIGNFIYQ